MTKKNGGKIVVINLQETRVDKQADLIINNKLDIVFEILFEKIMKIKFLSYDRSSPRLEIRLRNEDDVNENSSMILNVDNVVVDPLYLSSLTEPKVDVKIENDYVDILLLFSGKRKSGKDYSVSTLVKYIKNDSDLFNISLITIASPIKEEYAIKHNLDYEKLLDSSDYKEKYRLDMVKYELIHSTSTLI